MHTISNSDDVIDSRDVIKRIEELESDLQDEHQTSVLDRIEELKEKLKDEADTEDFEEWLKVNGDNAEVEELDGLRAMEDYEIWLETEVNSEEAEELKALQELNDEGKQTAEDWAHGATLIREDYFGEYCEELVTDIGDLPKDIPSYIVIDWEATAENLRVDYGEVDYDGVTYLVK